MEYINITIANTEERDRLIKRLSELQFEKPLPKSWDELEMISGFYISTESDILTMDVYNHNIFKTESQAKSSRAKSKLSQSMAEYNDGWKPDWGSKDFKFIISRNDNRLYTDSLWSKYHFLAFKTSDLRDEFLKNFEEDIKIFFEL